MQAAAAGYAGGWFTGAPGWYPRGRGSPHGKGPPPNGCSAHIGASATAGALVLSVDQRGISRLGPGKDGPAVARNLRLQDASPPRCTGDASSPFVSQTRSGGGGRASELSAVVHDPARRRRVSVGSRTGDRERVGAVGDRLGTGGVERLGEHARFGDLARNRVSRSSSRIAASMSSSSWPPPGSSGTLDGARQGGWDSPGGCRHSRCRHPRCRHWRQHQIGSRTGIFPVGTAGVAIWRHLGYGVPPWGSDDHGRMPFPPSCSSS
jgi:hypothetical protein